VRGLILVIFQDLSWRISAYVEHEGSLLEWGWRCPFLSNTGGETWRGFGGKSWKRGACELDLVSLVFSKDFKYQAIVWGLRSTKFYPLETICCQSAEHSQEASPCETHDTYFHCLSLLIWASELERVMVSTPSLCRWARTACQDGRGGWMGGWMDEWVGGWMDGWTVPQTDV
jgi:hypothetical protein